MNSFKILHRDDKARVGKLTTPHGVIETPSFNPVGTQATVKALTPKDLKEIGVQIVLGNTYHLMLRPGESLIKKMGGLHRFMGWDGPIMTDSGGFQVFSLGIALEQGVGKLWRENWTENTGRAKPRLNSVTEEGVTFQSHLDGSKHFLTPEKSIQIQKDLGADLIVAFDDLESPKYSYDETLKSLELSERWQLRSLKEFKKKKSSQLLYGVTHGGVFEDLRVRSTKFIDKYFDGIAIGGAFNNRKGLLQVLEWTIDNLSEEKPRHLLGIGEVEDLFEGIERGVDLFDCVAATRRARNGSLYICPQSGGKPQNSFTISISQSKFISDKKPIDPKCLCYTCQNFSRAYLRHLYISREILFHQLTTFHNVYFITNLVSEIRRSIQEGKFKSLKKSWLERTRN